MLVKPTVKLLHFQRLLNTNDSFVSCTTPSSLLTFFPSSLPPPTPTAQYSWCGLHGQQWTRYQWISVLYHLLQTAAPGHEVHYHWKVSHSRNRTVMERCGYQANHNGQSNCRTVCDGFLFADFNKDLEGIYIFLQSCKAAICDVDLEQTIWVRDGYVIKISAK